MIDSPRSPAECGLYLIFISVYLVIGFFIRAIQRAALGDLYGMHVVADGADP